MTTFVIVLANMYIIKIKFYGFLSSKHEDYIVLQKKEMKFPSLNKVMFVEITFLV